MSSASGQHGLDAAADAMLDRALAGDRQSLISLLETVGPIVRSRIVPKIGPRLRIFVDDDDVMQVTYLEAVTRLDAFKGGGASGFLAWVQRLADNNLIDAIRMHEASKRPDPRKRVGAGGVGDDPDALIGLVELVGVTSTTPSNTAEKNDMRNAIEAVLLRLPPDYASVIRQYDLAGKPIAEVAAELGRSEGAVYMLRARAHDRLRDLLPSESKFFSVT